MNDPRSHPILALLLMAAALSAAGAEPLASQEPGTETSLARRGYLVRSAGPVDGGPGARVRNVGEGSALQRAGFRQGDVVLSVGGVDVERWWEMEVLSRRFRSGRRVTVEGARQDVPLRGEAEVPPLPRETLEGVEVTLHGIRTPGSYPVRGVLTRPRAAVERLPAVLLAPWLSCDSVESPFGPGGDGMMRLLHEVAGASGWMTLRVDRPGVGDSDGPPCGELDFREELDAYRAGLAFLRGRPEVDPDRIVILGLSNGGGYAPLLAGPEGAAGYVAIGGWSGTWLEHMLDHERIRMKLAGASPGEVNAAMRRWVTFYDRFLNGRRTPAEVLAAHPELEPLWYGEPDGLYGRPASFHHDLQALNLDSAWAAVDAPVLAIWGDADWIMTREGHEGIVALARRGGSPSARLEVVEGMDHFLTIHPSMQHGFDGEEGPFAREAVDLVLGFLEALEER